MGASQNTSAPAGNAASPFANVRNVYMELTSRCNMNCKFCPYPVLRRPKQDMPREYVLKILGELKDQNKDLTFHVLGEPLLNSNFFEYARLCDEYNITYWLVTNGLLLTPQICDKLFSLKNLKNLEISFHTFTSHAFALRGCAMPFERYLEHIENAIFSKKRYDAGIQINIDIMYDLNILNGGAWGNFTSNDWNEFSQKLLVWAEKLRAEFLDAETRYPKYFHGRKRIFHRADHYLYRDFSDLPFGLFADLPEHIQWIRWEIFPDVFVTLKKFFFFTKNTPYLDNALPSSCDYQVEEAKNPACAWPVDLTILSNGKITFCCLDYEGELSCGNISKMSLAQAAQSGHRAQVIANPGNFELCRLCRGQLKINKKDGEKCW